MTRHNQKDKRKAPIAPRGFIALASRELGVTREHLSRVLHGHRQSQSLTARYTALMRSGATPHRAA